MYVILVLREKKMINKLGERKATKTWATIASLKTLLKNNKKAFVDFLVYHDSTSLWVNMDAYNWACEYVANNDL